MQLNIILIDAGIHFMKDHNNQDIIAIMGAFYVHLTDISTLLVYICFF